MKTKFKIKTECDLEMSVQLLEVTIKDVPECFSKSEEICLLIDDPKKETINSVFLSKEEAQKLANLLIFLLFKE